MGILQKNLRHLLLGALAVCLAACESKQELQTRMDDISGEYRLTGLSIGNLNLLDLIPREELEVIAVARIYGEGKEWIFEYTLPTITSTERSGGSSRNIFHYHQVRQPIVWDQQLGKYFFYRLEESDLSGSGIDPASVAMQIKGNSISFNSTANPLFCSWIKSR